MLNNVKKSNKQAVLGDNKGSRLAPKVCLPVDYSRDIATLVFLYLRNLEQLKTKEITPDPSWFIFNDFEGEILNGLSPSSDIPGYRPIGYAHGKSPVREKTFGETEQALLVLQDDHPASHALLLDQLGKLAGSGLEEEWDRVAKLHQDAQKWRTKLEEYESLARHCKRTKADSARYERIAEKYRKLLNDAEKTGPELMPLYSAVLDAAALLKPHLW